MRVVFLDIDRVLGPGAGRIEPDKVRRLNRITARTGAVIVASTAWRTAMPWPVFVRKLKQAGIKAPIISRTPNLGVPFEERWQEIKYWLDQHPEVTGYAILDDIEDFGPLAHRHVWTGDERRLGLQDGDVALAVLLVTTPRGRRPRLRA